MQLLNVFPISLRIRKTQHLHVSRAFCDFQQCKKLMILAAYWIKLKQVDISLLKHIKAGFFPLTMPRVSIADRNRALDYLEPGWTVPGVARHVGVHQSTIHRPTQLQIGHGAEDRG